MSLQRRTLKKKWEPRSPAGGAIFWLKNIRVTFTSTTKEHRYTTDHWFLISWQMTIGAFFLLLISICGGFSLVVVGSLANQGSFGSLDLSKIMCFHRSLCCSDSQSGAFSVRPWLAVALDSEKNNKCGLSMANQRPIFFFALRMPDHQGHSDSGFYTDTDSALTRKDGAPDWFAADCESVKGRII